MPTLAGCVTEKKNKINKKKHCGTCYFLRNCLISLSSIKQNSVALSRMEANMLQLEVVGRNFFG